MQKRPAARMGIQSNERQVCADPAKKKTGFIGIPGVYFTAGGLAAPERIHQTGQFTAKLFFLVTVNEYKLAFATVTQVFISLGRPQLHHGSQAREQFTGG